MRKHSRWARAGWVAGVVLGAAGAVPAQWINVTANLAGLPSECGNLCLLSVVPGQDRIIAGVAKQGLWQSTNGGGHWMAMGQGSNSDTIINRPSHLLYDPKHSGVFWESGIYNSFGVYRTADDGQTFQHLGTVRHNDYLSADFSDLRRSTLLVGGHEQSRTVWKSSDGGQTWTNIGTTMPEGTKFTTHPLVVDASTYLVNAWGWGKGAGGVYRTTDSGATWGQVCNLEPAGAALHASDGSLYWLLASDRGVIRSVDQGRTWKQVCGAGVLKGMYLIELPDGRLAALAGKSVKVSADHGATWTAVLDPLPGPAAGLIYAPARQAFFVWNWDCKDRVLTNAILRHDYRIEMKAVR